MVRLSRSVVLLLSVMSMLTSVNAGPGADRTSGSGLTALTDPVYEDGSSRFQGFGFDLLGRANHRAPPTDANGSIAVDANPAIPLAAGGAWVNVTTKCSGSSNTVGWWVGLFPASAPSPIRSVDPGDPK
jgi:hypothetical protein